MSRRLERRHTSGNSNTVLRGDWSKSSAGEPGNFDDVSVRRAESGVPPRASSVGKVSLGSRPASAIGNYGLQQGGTNASRRPSTALVRAPSAAVSRIPSAAVSRIPSMSQRPMTAQPRSFSRLSSSDSVQMLEFPDRSGGTEHKFHKEPDPRYPWRDPRKQLTSSTQWNHSFDGTKIKRFNEDTCKPECFKSHSPPPSSFCSTLRSKAPGGLMDSTIRPSSSSSGEVRKGLPKRPSTALGLSSSGANMSQLSYSFNRTRPPFDSMIPPPPREESEPVCMETLQKIRNKVYERAINLKTVFRRFDEDKSGTVSRAEFKKALAEMNLDFPSKVVNGLLDALDSDGGGEIEYNEFAAMLKTKDTLGEYNPFLLERTYFDGSCAPDDTHKRRNTKIKAKDVDRAYKLHDEISKRFYQRYRTPQHMFRDIDDNSNGAISSEEFAAKLKFLQIEATPEDIDNMIDVFQMSQPGQLIYRDFVEHFHQPDKWGFCSAYNPVLPLGKNGEKNVHPPIDSSTMQKTHWDKEGRPHPFELLKQKKQMLKDCVAEAQPLVMEQPTHTIVLPGKTKRGLLDKYLLEELRRKFTTMRKSTRDMFHILDPGNEGRISRDNFHKGMKRLNMGIPDKVLDELISFVDSDNCGYVEMPEFVELIEPSVEDMRIPKHNEDEIAEIDRLMSKPPSRGGMPPKEIHPLVQEYLRDGELKPSMLSMIQTSLEGKSSHLRNIFLKWDIDQDGFIDATELRKGLSSLNLGIPEGVIARIVNALDTDGNGKLDYNEFVGAFRKPDNLAGTNAISHERSLGHRFDGHGRNSFHDFVNFNSDSNSQGIAMPSKMKDLDTATILKTALAQHATWGGMPPAGLIKGNAAKTLDLNLHRIGYYGQGTGHDRIKKAPSSETSSRDLNASDKTAKGEILFYGRRSTTPSIGEGLIEARQPWKEVARDELRSSWQTRTEAKRQRVQSAHSTRRSASSLA